MNHFNVIKRPIVTEKSTALGEMNNQYAFVVDLDANKFQIRDAVEKLFGVHVTSVHTAIFAGKRKRFGRNVGKRSNWKKAIVTLREGDSIEIFTDVGDEIDE